MSGRIRRLRLYRGDGHWAFDDPAVGLRREPFIGWTNALIDLLVVDSGLDLAMARRRGFTLSFGDRPFDGAVHRFDWSRAGDGGGGGGGHFYRLAATREGRGWAGCSSVEGWLCPALLRYFAVAPKRLYAKASRNAHKRGSNECGAGAKNRC